MKKYWAVFRISWQKRLEYRFNFFLERLRNIVILLLLYYLWHNLTLASGRFAGYFSPELFTYVFAASLLKSAVFGGQSRTMAQEINNGDFSTYLVKPVNHFLYIFFQELAERSLYLLCAIFEVLIFILLLRPPLFWQSDFKLVGLFLVAVIFALLLYLVLSYLVSLLAFWSREAMGPRFLYEWILEFASGAYFPLNVLSHGFLVFLHFLPFAYLIYFPLSIYLGKLNSGQINQVFLVQLGWIIAAGFLCVWVWHKGLKRYTGEGI